MGPPSTDSSTRCTVGPVTFAPALYTSACTRMPYMPLPPAKGRREGCMLRILKRYCSMNEALRM